MLPALGWDQIRAHAHDDVQAFHARSAIAALNVALKTGGWMAATDKNQTET